MSNQSNGIEPKLNLSLSLFLSLAYFVWQTSVSRWTSIDTANRIYSLMCAFHCDSILIVAQLSVHNVIYITRKFNFIICSTCSSPLFKAHTFTVYNIESPFRWLIHISFVKSVATQCSIICGVANRKGGSSSVQSASSAPSTSFDVQQFIEIHAAKNKTKKTKFHQPIHRIGI